MRRLFLNENIFYISLQFILVLGVHAQSTCSKTKNDRLQCFKLYPNNASSVKSTCQVPQDKERFSHDSACEEGACVFQVEDKINVCLLEADKLDDSNGTYCNPAKDLQCNRIPCDMIDGRCVGNYVCTIFDTQNTDADIRICEYFLADPSAGFPDGVQSNGNGDSVGCSDGVKRRTDLSFGDILLIMIGVFVHMILVLVTIYIIYSCLHRISGTGECAQRSEIENSPGSSTSSR